MVVFSDLRFDYRVFRQATSLHQEGHRISIVSSTFSPDPLQGWDHIEIHPIRLDRSRSLRLSYPTFWRRAFRCLLSLNADVYHAHDLDALWPAAKAARRRQVPLIYDSHEFWTEQSSLVHRPLIRTFWSLLERRLIRQVDHIITVSNSIAQALQERYHLATVTVVRNLPVYKPPVNSDRIRTELGLAAERPIALYQGGFLTENGLSEQIAAASHLDEAAFVLIGGGPTEAELKAQVQQAGLENKVYFIPRVPFDQLHDYTCSADLGLCLIKGTGLSFYHSMPNKLFEYMMAGLPVLASDFPEMRTVIEDTEAGEVIDPQNVALIGERLNALLGDRKRRRNFGQAALKAALRYNWEAEVHRLTELYSTL